MIVFIDFGTPFALLVAYQDSNQTDLNKHLRLFLFIIL
jgi:hypothetical protein